MGSAEINDKTAYRFLTAEEVCAQAWAQHLVDARSTPQHLYLGVIRANSVMAIAKLFRAPDNIDLAFIETDPNARNQGLAKELIGAVVEYAKSQNMALTTNGYTDNGHTFVARHLTRIAATHGVTFISVPGG